MIVFFPEPLVIGSYLAVAVLRCCGFWVYDNFPAFRAK